MKRGGTGMLGVLVFVWIVSLVLMGLAFFPMGVQRVRQLWRAHCAK